MSKNLPIQTLLRWGGVGGGEGHVTQVQVDLHVRVVQTRSTRGKSTPPHSTTPARFEWASSCSWASSFMGKFLKRASS